MKVRTHQQVEGAEAGAVIDVDDERGQWLVSNGYASQDQADLEEPGPTAGEAPAKGATKAEWVAHAVAQGAVEDDAEAMTKADLMDAYG